MPYWGANVRNHSYVVTAKVHGHATSQLYQDEIIEYISNLARSSNVPESELAEFFATKIAAAVKDDPDALWVEVNITTTDGKIYGFTELVEEMP